MKLEINQKNAKLLCDLAAEAWKQAGPRTRKVRFMYRGQRYSSVLTSFRMLVQTARGEPLFCRYHDW